MEPWKKVSNIDSSFDSKSSKAKELKTDMDTFNMLAILDKLNQNNISKLDKEVIDSTENDVKSKSEYQQSEVKSSNELQLENQDKSLEDMNNNSDINALGDDNSSDEAKTDTASDADKKQS